MLCVCVCVCMCMCVCMSIAYLYVLHISCAAIRVLMTVQFENILAYISISIRQSFKFTNASVVSPSSLIVRFKSMAYTKET